MKYGYRLQIFILIGMDNRIDYIFKMQIQIMDIDYIYILDVDIQYIFLR